MTPDGTGFPFDQYQRYSTVRDLVSEARSVLGADRLRVLDVGGFFWDSRSRGLPIQVMLPEDRPLVVDVVRDHESLRGQRAYVCASGGALPFADESFDVVVSCDTLEHVPGPARTHFIQELARVTRRYLILAAPMDNPKTRLAEEIVGEFVRLHLGRVQVQLGEHALNGLPRPDDVLLALEGAGLESLSFPAEDLYGWLFMMLAKHYLMSMPDSDRLHELVDRFYCVSFPQGPLPESEAHRGYRRFFVASKSPGDPLLARVARRLRTAESATEPESDLRSGAIAPELMLSQMLLALATRRSGADGPEREVERVGVAFEGGRTAVGELAGDRRVGQTFVSHRANLCRIDLLLATYARRNSGTLCFRLREDGPEGREVAEVRVDAAAVLDNKWRAFRFPPQSGSRNRAYHFEVSHVGAVDGDALTLYHSPGESVPAMSRYENGIPVGGLLAFRSYFVPASAEEERLVEEASSKREVERLRAEMARLRDRYERDLSALRDERLRPLRDILLAVRAWRRR